MTTFLENYGNLIDKIFGNFDRPFKEIEQYKLYRKDDTGYLLVVNALGLDKEHLNVVLEYANSEDCVEGHPYFKRMPVLKVTGKKKNKITGVEYSISLGLGVNIKEEIENVFFDCQDGVCVINITVKEDSKSLIKAKEIPEDFSWN